MDRQKLKPVQWVGSSKEDLKSFPAEVRDRFGFALYQAQSGLKHRHAKPLKGFGPGVLEVVSRHEGGAYRAVYTVRFREVVYVLHAFQKKAKKGIATPRKEMETVMRRLKAATRHWEESYGKRNRPAKSGEAEIERGSGNVYADLGVIDADTQFLKAELVTGLDEIIRQRRLTQTDAAKLLGLSQPDVSRLLRGDFREYSVERLLRLLLLLGRDIEIVIRDPRSRGPGRISVEAA